MAKEHEDTDELDPKDTELEGNAEHDSGETEDHEEHEDDDKTAKVDSEIDEAETEEAREEIRARRRQERKSRSQRNRERVDALERNLQAITEQNRILQQQVSSIQDVNTGSQLAQIDSDITRANQAAEHFKSIIADAATKNDGKTLAEATEYMIAARTRAQQLTDFKNKAVQSMNKPQPADPETTSYAQKFLGSNKWYGGPKSKDRDSKVLTMLDNDLTSEGWVSNSPAYWAELQSRVDTYLPHRSQKKTANTQTQQRSPVSGGGSQSSGGGSSAFSLSAERVQAIKSAGMWDDPAARAKMIKTYREYDKANKG